MASEHSAKILIRRRLKRLRNVVKIRSDDVRCPADKVKIRLLIQQPLAILPNPAIANVPSIFIRIIVNVCRKMTMHKIVIIADHDETGSRKVEHAGQNSPALVKTKGIVKRFYIAFALFMQSVRWIIDSANREWCR